MKKTLQDMNAALAARATDIRLGVRAFSTEPTLPTIPADQQAALDAARYEAEAARAESARIKKELEEIKKQLPSEEQRARYAELEQQHREAEEQRLKKEGDFNAWRTQILDQHEKALEAERQMRMNAEAKSATTDRELNDTLISREFSDATELFGPSGKTVLMAEIARAYFADHVEVQVLDGPAGRPVRRVVVKDMHGAVIVDAKSGKPQAFATAMQELIDSHPRKEHMLRGSGKSGSGSLGGHNGGSGELDTSRLKPADFDDPKVREAVRAKQAGAGGLQIGPGFDRYRKKG